MQNDPTTAQFSRQLLALGNGQIPVDVSTCPKNFFEFTSSKKELITKVFPGIKQNYKNIDWISERAIPAAKNKDVDCLNFIIQNQMPGELHSYKYVDSVSDETEATNYPTEFLSSLDVPGTPPHNLQLKVGSTIIRLCNLNQPKLCNDSSKDHKGQIQSRGSPHPTNTHYSSCSSLSVARSIGFCDDS